jgi:hypothetical protein
MRQLVISIVYGSVCLNYIGAFRVSEFFCEFKCNNIAIKSCRNDYEFPFTAKQELSQDINTKPEHVNFIYQSYLDDHELVERSMIFYELMNQRRSVRFYDERSFPIQVLENCIRTGASAPSGAHQQPWHFAIVGSAEIKKKIRTLVEREEQLNYDERMRKSWVNDVTPFLNNTQLYKNGIISKPYLEEAPYLVVLFEQLFGVDEKGPMHSIIFIQ